MAGNPAFGAACRLLPGSKVYYSSISSRYQAGRLADLLCAAMAEGGFTSEALRLCLAATLEEACMAQATREETGVFLWSPVVVECGKDESGASLSVSYSLNNRFLPVYLDIVKQKHPSALSQSLRERLLQLAQMGEGLGVRLHEPSRRVELAISFPLAGWKRETKVHWEAVTGDLDDDERPVQYIQLADVDHANLLGTAELESGKASKAPPAPSLGQVLASAVRPNPQLETAVARHVEQTLRDAGPEELAQFLSQAMPPEQLAQAVKDNLSRDEVARILVQANPKHAAQVLKDGLSKEEFSRLVRETLSPSERAEALVRASPEEAAQMLKACLSEVELSKLLKDGLNEEEQATLLAKSLPEAEVARLVKGALTEPELARRVAGGLPEAELARLVKGVMETPDLAKKIIPGLKEEDFARIIKGGVPPQELIQTIISGLSREEFAQALVTRLPAKDLATLVATELPPGEAREVLNADARRLARSGMSAASPAPPIVVTGTLKPEQVARILDPSTPHEEIRVALSGCMPPAAAEAMLTGAVPKGETLKVLEKIVPSQAQALPLLAKVLTVAAGASNLTGPQITVGNPERVTAFYQTRVGHLEAKVRELEEGKDRLVKETRRTFDILRGRQPQPPEPELPQPAPIFEEPPLPAGRKDTTQILAQRVRDLETQLREVEKEKLELVRERKREQIRQRAGAAPEPSGNAGGGRPESTLERLEGFETGAKAQQFLQRRVRELEMQLRELEEQKREAERQAKAEKIRAALLPAQTGPGALGEPGSSSPNEPPPADAQLGVTIEKGAQGIDQGVEALHGKAAQIREQLIGAPIDSKTRERIDSIMRSLTVKKGELNLLTQQLAMTIKRKEVELKVLDATLREELRQARQQMNQQYAQIDRLKELNARIQDRLMAAKEASSASAQQQGQLRIKSERLGRLSSLLQKRVKRMQSRRKQEEALGKTDGPGGETDRRVESAEKALQAKKQEVVQLNRALGEKARVEAELNRAIRQLQHDLKQQKKAS